MAATALAAPQQWTHGLAHGWGSVRALAIVNGSYTNVLSDEAVHFVGRHYQGATFSSCSGASNYSAGGDVNSVEVSTAKTHQRVKAVNPEIKSLLCVTGDCTGRPCNPLQSL